MKYMPMRSYLRSMERDVPDDARTTRTMNISMHAGFSLGLRLGLQMREHGLPSIPDCLDRIAAGDLKMIPETEELARIDPEGYTGEAGERFEEQVKDMLLVDREVARCIIVVRGRDEAKDGEEKAS